MYHQHLFLITSQLLISCSPEIQGSLTRLNCPIANPLRNGAKVRLTHKLILIWFPAQSAVLGIRLRPTSSITGSEGTLSIQFNATSINPEMSNTLADNSIEYVMYVQAQADVYLDQAWVNLDNAWSGFTLLPLLSPPTSPNSRSVSCHM